ncbi:MAG: hypothetical protein V4692_06030, partial [Bdellovibrionota bacterium]
MKTFARLSLLALMFVGHSAFALSPQSDLIWNMLEEVGAKPSGAMVAKVEVERLSCSMTESSCEGRVQGIEKEVKFDGMMAELLKRAL